MDTYFTAETVYKRICDNFGNHAIDYFYDDKRIIGINKNQIGRYVLMFQNRRYAVVNKSAVIEARYTK